MTTETQPCLKCTTDIATAASRCPECGYEPYEIGLTSRKARIVLNIVLCLTVIGAIIGLPGLYYVWRVETKAKDRKPTNYHAHKKEFVSELPA